jgi:hypothetical protein
VPRPAARPQRFAAPRKGPVVSIMRIDWPRWKDSAVKTARNPPGAASRPLPRLGNRQRNLRAVFALPGGKDPVRQGRSPRSQTTTEDTDDTETNARDTARSRFCDLRELRSAITESVGHFSVPLFLSALGERAELTKKIGDRKMGQMRTVRAATVRERRAKPVIRVNLTLPDGRGSVVGDPGVFKQPRRNIGCWG